MADYYGGITNNASNAGAEARALAAALLRCSPAASAYISRFPPANQPEASVMTLMYGISMIEEHFPDGPPSMEQLAKALKAATRRRALVHSHSMQPLQQQRLELQADLAMAPKTLRDQLDLRVCICINLWPFDPTHENLQHLCCVV
jgi:hypothetical protein